MGLKNSANKVMQQDFNVFEEFSFELKKYTVHENGQGHCDTGAYLERKVVQFVELGTRIAGSLEKMEFHVNEVPKVFLIDCTLSY